MIENIKHLMGYRRALTIMLLGLKPVVVEPQVEKTKAVWTVLTSLMLLPDTSGETMKIKVIGLEAQLLKEVEPIPAETGLIKVKEGKQTRSKGPGRNPNYLFKRRIPVA